MKPLVRAITHVQVAIPVGGEDEARAFYIYDPFGNRLEFRADD